mgnify:CR=1 FL=1
MNHLIARTGLFDDFFKDVAPGFYVRPLHGDSLPSPSQIKIDVKETPSAYTVVAEVPVPATVKGSLLTILPETWTAAPEETTVAPTAAATSCLILPTASFATPLTLSDVLLMVFLRKNNQGFWSLPKD